MRPTAKGKARSGPRPKSSSAQTPCHFRARNEDIARAFDEIADILELKNDNPFRIRAYRTAARVLRGLPTEVGEMLRRGENLDELPGVGEDLAAQITEMVETGHLAKLTELAASTPRLARELMRLPNVGSKRAMRLCEELGAQSLDDVRRAGKEGEIRALPGFGAKFEQALLESLSRTLEKHEKRFKLATTQGYANALLDYLSHAPGFEKAEIAGSFRRRKETVGDLDIIVAGREQPKSDRLVHPLRRDRKCRFRRRHARDSYASLGIAG